MVKIIRIIGVIIFLLTLSTDVWAKQIATGGVSKESKSVVFNTPKPVPTQKPIDKYLPSANKMMGSPSSCAPTFKAPAYTVPNNQKSVVFITPEPAPKSVSNYNYLSFVNSKAANKTGLDNVVSQIKTQITNPYHSPSNFKSSVNLGATKGISLTGIGAGVTAGGKSTFSKAQGIKENTVTTKSKSDAWWTDSKWVHDESKDAKKNQAIMSQGLVIREKKPTEIIYNSRAEYIKGDSDYWPIALGP